MEKIVVKNYLYPILDNPTCSHLFRDQYAFRPTGSTTCALINLTHRLTKLLQEYPYVHLLAFDFSKAFDTVRHSTLLEKSAKLPIQDFAHNWLLDFLEDRQHCTKFNGKTSVFLLINASIVQGSRIGPIAYVINASDLRVWLGRAQQIRRRLVLNSPISELSFGGWRAWAHFSVGKAEQSLTECVEDEGDDREETSDEVEESTTMSAWSNQSGEHEYPWCHLPRWSQVYWAGGPSSRSWCSDPLCHQNPEESWTVWSTTLGSHPVNIPELTYIIIIIIIKVLINSFLQMSESGTIVLRFTCVCNRK